MFWSGDTYYNVQLFNVGFYLMFVDSWGQHSIVTTNEITYLDIHDNYAYMNTSLGTRTSKYFIHITCGRLRDELIAYKNQNNIPPKLNMDPNTYQISLVNTTLVRIEGDIITLRNTDDTLIAMDTSVIALIDSDSYNYAIIVRRVSVSGTTGYLLAYNVLGSVDDIQAIVKYKYEYQI